MSNKKTIKQEIAEAKQKLAARKKLCDGCFGMRNNLIVKTHLEKVWLTIDITIGEKKVVLPCKKCGVPRELPLSNVSINLLKADMERYLKVILLKDGKYNTLVGFGPEKPVNLDGFI